MRFPSLESSSSTPRFTHTPHTYELGKLMKVASQDEFNEILSYRESFSSSPAQGSEMRNHANSSKGSCRPI